MKLSKTEQLEIFRNLFGQEKGDYHKLAKVGNFGSRNYIEYENNGDRNKTISIVIKLDHI